MYLPSTDIYIYMYIYLYMKPLMEHDRFLHEIKHLNVYIIYMTAVNIIDLSTELCDARCLFHFSFVWSIHGKCHASRDAHALFVTSFQSILWSSMKILTWDIRVEEDFHGNFTTSKMLFINTFKFSSPAEVQFSASLFLLQLDWRTWLHPRLCAET